MGGRCGLRRGRHRAFGIEEMLVIGAKAEFDEGAGVGRGFRLPAVVGLILFHGFLRCVVPDAGSFSVEVVFTNQGFLDFAGALRINFLLAVA